MESALSALEALIERHAEVGKDLYDRCEASLFPADTVALAVLDRSMSLIRGFVLLARNGDYIPAAGLLRMQLDNVLRFYGIKMSGDPHGVANKVIQGVALRKIADSSGEKMTDARLKELLAITNPWVNHVYALSSGYIHLSEQHVMHLMQRSARDENGVRQLAIGDEDEYLSEEQRLDLANTFLVIARGVLKLVESWASDRESYGTKAELGARFKSAV